MKLPDVFPSGYQQAHLLITFATNKPNSWSRFQYGLDFSNSLPFFQSFKTCKEKRILTGKCLNSISNNLRPVSPPLKEKINYLGVQSSQ